MLATGKPAFASYRGAYHGLSFGTLAISGIAKFREPFEAMVERDSLLLDYPHESADTNRELTRVADALAARDDIAALVIEPIQGRGGCIVPPSGYLTALQELCNARGILTIVDEIYTGFGRTGAWFALDYEGVTPDILCIGKAMGSGFPISAAIARAEIMDAWPISTGEALHTSTYLGNPMGCAAALATISELNRLQLPSRAARLGTVIRKRLEPLQQQGLVRDVRGRGMFWGLQLSDAAVASAVVARALAAGVILLQAGPLGDVISIAPPLVIAERQLHRALDIVEAALHAAA
jgi:4-aminobutyrate aminotransferase-like enzyme